MSDSEEENYVTFGVPLDPLDEENIPRKKPVTIEDQYAYDAQGRRRFHGAFTGGFSAGYFNTVGTRDGWKPQQFKSSRSSKADNIIQRPEDFMDEEDTSLFGIAPKGIQATSDYADHGQKGKKRERMSQDNSGPIPGAPVLKELLKPVKETIGIVLLKKMGWKPGQGVGSRLTKREKQKIKQRNERLKLVQENPEMTGSNSEDSDDNSINITFAPDDYEPFRCKPKDNYFGIGYSGLDRRKILSGHINLFDTPAFCVQDKNKKLSIHGQAFGVGAFEADDEDIYEREDMSRYDFALDDPKHKKKTRWSQDALTSSQTDCLDGFIRAKGRLASKKIFKPPELPKDFMPVHTVRKSRFYPPIAIPVENSKRKEPLNAVDRARILEDPDERSRKPPSSKSVASNIISNTLNLHGKQQTEERRKLENQQATTGNSWLDKLNVQNFVKGGIVGVENDTGSLKTLEDFKEFTSASVQSSTETSTERDSSSKNERSTKLFSSDPDKQRRFEQYLIFVENNERNKLETIQPLSMTEWEREQERTEFEQAARLEQSNNYMVDKFIHSADQIDKTDPEKDIKEAVRLKMFGKLTRERSEWRPTSIVCKRFNIPEPKVGCAPVATDQKSVRFSIFDSLDWCSSSKFTKATEQEIQTKEAPRSSKETEENANKISDTDNTLSNDYQYSEPVSEKSRIFEASYEKVFGKGIQNILSLASENSKEDVSDNLENKTIQEVENKQEIDTESISTVKDQANEKKDLFKAIFLSSSEDSEDSEPEENVDNETVKSILIGKDPKEINIHRNTSPPRGIFAKVDLDNLVTHPKRVNDESTASKIPETNLPTTDETRNNLTDSNEVIDDTETAILPDMYGPILPQRLLKQESTATAEASSTNQSLKPVFRSIVVSKTAEASILGGKWVERNKAKKSKKEKKKHKHKEHKSPKHKKKSKKEKRSKH